VTGRNGATSIAVSAPMIGRNHPGAERETRQMWPFTRTKKPEEPVGKPDERNKKLEEHPVSGLEFLYEQDGETERRLKGDLMGLLQQNTDVERAYLAKAVNDREETVMLCLATSADAPDLRLPPQIGKIFTTIFSAKYHLDILFLGEDQEAQLTEVCKPFYIRSITQ
jgi:hypothetical protein